MEHDCFHAFDSKVRFFFKNIPFLLKSEISSCIIRDQSRERQEGAEGGIKEKKKERRKRQSRCVIAPPPTAHIKNPPRSVRKLSTASDTSRGPRSTLCRFRGETTHYLLAESRQPPPPPPEESRVSGRGTSQTGKATKTLEQALTHRS